MRINVNLSPLGGYRFRDVDGVNHRGDSWGSLLRSIAQYRARHGKPPGDPEAEVTAAVCQAEPSLCLNDGGPSGLERPDAMYNTRVGNWLASMLRMKHQGRLALVNKAEARKRAAICQKCPFQKHWEGGCSSCNTSNKTVRHAIVGGSLADDGLLGCKALSEDTKLSVHLDVAKVANDALPSHCWRKQK